MSRKVIQDTFLEKYAGRLGRLAPARAHRVEGQRLAYAKAGVDPKKAARRWS